MFELEKAIADWRQRMLTDGIKSPAPLDELESHLREEIERQMKSESNEQQAFEIAVEKIGQASELKIEFKKIGGTMETRLVKLMGAACVAVAFLFSLWISLFLFGLETGSTAKAFGLAAFAVTALGWKYIHKLLPVIRNHWLRTAIGLACCFGGVIWMQLFIVDFVPHMMIHPHSVTPSGTFLAVFLWGWAVMATLGGVGYGLEKAAHKRNAAAGSRRYV